MSNTQETAPISVRVPAELKARLLAACQRDERSQSYIVAKAVRRELDRIDAESLAE